MFTTIIAAKNSEEINKDTTVTVSLHSNGQNQWGHTLTLSHQDYEHLKITMDSIQKKLDKAETKEETIKIYQDAIQEFYHYGLFPDTIQVKQIQNLMLGIYSYPRIINNIKLVNSKNGPSVSDVKNILCLVAGKTDRTVVQGLRSKITSIFQESLYNFMWHLSELLDAPCSLLFVLYLFTYLFRMGNLLDFSPRFPIALGSSIGIGTTNSYPFNQSFFAHGWVHTIGLNGIKKYNGSLLGILPKNFVMTAYNKASAINGFTGINIVDGNQHFYMGSALKVGLQTE